MPLRRAAISVLSALLLAPLVALAPAAPAEAAAGGRFVTTWDTSSRHRVLLHLYGDVDVTVDWGDGTRSVVSGERSPSTHRPVRHTYDRAVEHAEVTVTGTFTRFGRFPVDYDFVPTTLLTVEEWGPTGTTDLSGAFAEAGSLTAIAEIPTGVTDADHMFYGADDFNQPIADWDVSQVRDMEGMFARSGFNQPIGAWDVSRVENMSAMFSGSLFNQPIGSWDVSNVTEMASMFSAAGGRGYGRGPFDQPIGGWDVSNVTDMSGMFEGSAFNRFIGNWDVSAVTSMARMFSGINHGDGVQAITSFNRAIGEWDVSNVVSMAAMFNRSVFNRPIGAWDVSNVTDMTWMFLSSRFNQPIGGWDVSNVTATTHMFGSSLFNQPIGDWDTSGLTEMSGMFAGSRFNQPIGGWDVSGIRHGGDMHEVFETARDFNQDLSAWCVPSIESAPQDFDYFATSWVLPRPVWGTCPGDPDYRPVGTFTSVTDDGGAILAEGTATAPDHGVEAVAVGIRDLATGQWLHRDGTWGSYEKIWTVLTDPGAATTGWRIRRALPPGSYGLSLFVKDTWGIPNAEPRPWRVVDVS